MTGKNDTAASYDFLIVSFLLIFMASGLLFGVIWLFTVMENPLISILAVYGVFKIGNLIFRAATSMATATKIMRRGEQ